MLDWLLNRKQAHTRAPEPEAQEAQEPQPALPTRSFERKADRLFFKVQPEDLVRVQDHPFYKRMHAKIESGELTMPLMADSAGEVLALCSDPQADAFALSRTLLRDQSMTAHVLRVANSAHYGSEKRVTSLNQAIVRLGLNKIKEIAVGVLLRERIISAPGHEHEARLMWDHAALSAGFSREIAQRVNADADMASLCALLHDIGGPVLFQAAHDLTKSMHAEIPPEVVRTTCSAFHARVGSELAKRWNLPDEIVRVIACYRDREPATERRRSAQIVGLADLLAGWALDPWAAQSNAPGADDPRRAALSISDGDWSAIVASLPRVRAGAMAYVE